MQHAFSAIYSRYPCSAVYKLSSETTGSGLYYQHCFHEWPYLRQILFPSNCFFSYRMPDKTIPANVPPEKKKLFIGSDIYCAEKMIISCGQWNVGSGMTSYYIDIYGNLKNRVNLHAHLIVHVNYCKTIANSVVEIKCFLWMNGSIWQNIYELVKELDMEKDRERLQIICEYNPSLFKSEKN